MNIRKITSLTMLISFVLCIMTSVILYIMPHGRVAYWSHWQFWGLSKNQWCELHLNLGFLFVLSGFLHVYYNWQLITVYLKNKSKQMKVFTVNFNIAMLLTFIVGIGTYFQIPPMSSIINFSELIKDSASIKYGEPPYGHAELSSLKMFVQKANLDLSKSVELLRQAGVKYKKETQTIDSIAIDNDMTPMRVYEIIKPASLTKNTGEHLIFPDSPPPGFGSNKLDDVCITFGLNISEIIQTLSQKRIEAKPSQSIKEIAGTNSISPMAIFEIIKATSNNTP